jgi:hypothetical protein
MASPEKCSDSSSSISFSHGRRLLFFPLGAASFLPILPACRWEHRRASSKRRSEVNSISNQIIVFFLAALLADPSWCSARQRKESGIEINEGRRGREGRRSVFLP